MRHAIRDIESLLHQHKQTLQAARRPQQPSDMPTRFSASLDGGGPTLIAVTMAALIALAVGLASAAFAFMPATTVTETVITKTDPLRTLTSNEIADRGYSRLKDRFCQVAFSGQIPTASLADRLDVRLKADDEPPVVAFTPQRKYVAGNKVRDRSSHSLRVQAKRQPSLLERFTGVHL